MTAAFTVLILLIAVLPTLMVVDGSLADGLVSAIVAIAMVTAGLTLPTSELNRFSRLLRPTGFIVLFVPCLWMLLQVLPISTQSLANSVWVSASTALGKPFIGAVSLDIGATLLAVVRYCTVLAAAFVSASISLNKSGAENLLSLLTGIAVLIAIELIGFDLGYLRLLGYERLAEPASGMNIVVMGVVLSCAMAIRSYEHLDSTRRNKPRTIAMVAGSASVLGWEGGALSTLPGGCKVGIRLLADSKASADARSAATGDKEFLSNDATVLALKPSVGEILIGY